MYHMRAHVTQFMSLATPQKKRIPQFLWLTWSIWTRLLTPSKTKLRAKRNIKTQFRYAPAWALAIGDSWQQLHAINWTSKSQSRVLLGLPVHGKAWLETSSNGTKKWGAKCSGTLHTVSQATMVQQHSHHLWDRHPREAWLHSSTDQTFTRHTLPVNLGYSSSQELARRYRAVLQQLCKERQRQTLQKPRQCQPLTRNPERRPG